MKKISDTQKRLIADFMANIGVAWFAGGIVSVFLGLDKTSAESLLSVMWGIIFSIIFLGFGIYTLKGVRK